MDTLLLLWRDIFSGANITVRLGMFSPRTAWKLNSFGKTHRFGIYPLQILEVSIAPRIYILNLKLKCASDPIETTPRCLHSSTEA